VFLFIIIIIIIKEPSGLLRTDGKRLDGVTLLPWKNGRCATWDVTVTDTMAESYLHNTSHTAERKMCHVGRHSD